MLQPTPEGKAIWKATITSESGWSHSFTLLRLSPALIWEADERPAVFAGSVAVETATDETNSTDTPALPETSEAPSPTRQDAMDELIALMEPQPVAAPEITPPAPTETQQPAQKPESAPAPPASHPAPSAEHFMAWLQHALTTRKLILNDAKALVHTVDNTAFLVSPGIFQRYAQEHPQTEVLAKKENQQDWQWLQKRFEKLNLHRRHPSGLNIWTCTVTGPRKSRHLHGYLLNDANTLFGDIPPDNPHLSLFASHAEPPPPAA